MAVNSALLDLRPSYGASSGTNSQAAKFAAFAKALPEKTPATADGSRATGTRVDDTASQGAAITENGGGSANPAYADPAADSQLQSEWEQARRAGEAAAGKPTRGTAGSSTGQTSAAIALYKRVSQIGSDEPTSSELLRRWNSIVQGGQGTDDEATVTSQAYSQNNAARFESGILDLTA